GAPHHRARNGRLLGGGGRLAAPPAFGTWSECRTGCRHHGGWRAPRTSPDRTWASAQPNVQPTERTTWRRALPHARAATRSSSVEPRLGGGGEGRGPRPCA